MALWRACTASKRTRMAHNSTRITHPSTTSAGTARLHVLQVCTLDLLNRYTCEGYGWLGLGSCLPASTGIHYVRTWKPAGVDVRLFARAFVGKRWFLFVGVHMHWCACIGELALVHAC